MMRTRRFRFMPQMDILSLRVVPSVSAPGAEIDPGEDCGDTSAWTQDADNDDSGADCSTPDDPSATDGAIDALCDGMPADPSNDPMAPQVPGNSVYTETYAVMPVTAIC